MGLHYLNKLIHPLETYMSLLIWQLIFFLNPVNKDHQKRFVFSWQSQQYSFTVLPPGYINPPGLCHNLLSRQFDHLSLLQDFILAHYVDAITQIGPNE